MSARPLRPLYLALLAALAPACGQPAEEDFAAQLPEELCAWAADCALEPSPTPTCEEEVAQAIDAVQADAGCAFHPDEAAGCLAALDAGCEDRVAVYYECKRSWRGDGCDVDLSEALAPGSGG